MRTTRRVLRAISMILAASLVLSCDNNNGIFATVQGEKAQSGDTIFQKTPVYTAFRLNNHYYAATAKLVARTASPAGSWATVAIGSPAKTDYTLRSVVLSGGTTIYALVESSGSESVYSSIDGATWTAITTPPSPSLTSIQSFSLDALYAAGGAAYLETHVYTDGNPGTSSYSLYYLDATGFSTKVTGIAPATDKSFRGVGYDGSLYWFASEDLLYYSASSTNAATRDTTSQLSGKTIWDISSTGAYVYVGTTDGVLLRLKGAAQDMCNSFDSYTLSQVIELPSSTGTEILVGTDTADSGSANGYYEGNYTTFSSGENGAVAYSSAIYATTVSTFPVHAFFYDTAAKTVFICVSPGTTSTKYYGLYSSVWDPSGKVWSGWSAE